MITKVSEHEETVKLCNRAIYEFSNNITVPQLTGFINALNAYSWITEVNSFIEDYNKFLQENTNSIALEGILNLVESSTYSLTTYKNVIEDLRSIIPLDESDIKGEIATLEKHSYVPSLQKFLKKAL